MKVKTLAHRLSCIAISNFFWLLSYEHLKLEQLQKSAQKNEAAPTSNICSSTTKKKLEIAIQLKRCVKVFTFMHTSIQDQLYTLLSKKMPKDVGPSNATCLFLVFTHEIFQVFFFRLKKKKVLLHTLFSFVFFSAILLQFEVSPSVKVILFNCLTFFYSYF